jgi:pimeloyl-ACP methyl ester carboxylesterase
LQPSRRHGKERPLENELVTDLSSISVHGRRAAYRRAGGVGRRPCIVLVHGIAGDSSEWAPVLGKLSESYDVVAPDLAGHGESTRLRGDHSIGAFATWLRDLLQALEVERATFVGHSLGGGVVMQFAYQFPEYVERMVLVSSGGLGREVSAFIRAASLPGAEWVVGGIGAAARRAEPLLGAFGLSPRTERGELVHRIAGLADADRRAAFVRAVRAIASPGGQRVNAMDRLYLAEDVPTLIIWGARDRVIPVHHAHATHDAVPGSELVVFDHAGHFPHADDPERFTAVVTDFLRSTKAASYDKNRTRRRMTSR